MVLQFLEILKMPMPTVGMHREREMPTERAQTFPNIAALQVFMALRVT
jgi:hypothetical protein